MRVWLTVLGLIMFAVIGAGTIWWFFASSLGERQLASAQQRLADKGYVLKYSSVERSGYPFRLEWLLQDVSVQAEAADSDGEQPAARGTAETIQFSANLWSPQRLAYQVGGRHVWVIDSRGQAGLIEVTIEQTTGTVRPQDSAPGWFLDADLAEIVAQSEMPSAPPLLIGAANAEMRMPRSMDAMAVNLRVHDVTLPRDDGLGRAVQEAAMRAIIDPLPRGFEAEDLQAWQGAGGSVSIEDANLKFGPVEGSAGGVVGLDESLRGRGNVTLRLREPKKLIAAGVDAGWIQGQQQQMLNLAMGLFSRRSESGKPEVSLPLSLREGGLWIGPLRLMDLPPVVQP